MPVPPYQGPPAYVNPYVGYAARHRETAAVLIEPRKLRHAILNAVLVASREQWRTAAPGFST